MTSVQRENCLLSEKLSQQKEESEALVEKEKELSLQVEELEKELREVKSTMETSRRLTYKVMPFFTEGMTVLYDLNVRS